MRCPSCNKMAAYDSSQEPEITNLEAAWGKDETQAQISGSVRIVLLSECCSEELKEANFEIDSLTVDVERGEGCECEELTVDTTSAENTDRRETHETVTAKRGPDKGKTVRKPIPPRYQKQFYGVHLEMSLECGCGKTKAVAVFDDDVQASSMDELV